MRSSRDGQRNSSSQSSSSSSSNGFNTSSLIGADSTAHVFSAFRPLGTSPSKQRPQELDEHEESYKKLLAQEEKINVTPANKLNDKVNELKQLIQEFQSSADAASSYMVSKAIGKMPLNKTFFNVYQKFQEKATSLQRKINAIQHWVDDVSCILSDVNAIDEFPSTPEEALRLAGKVKGLNDTYVERYNQIKPIIGERSEQNVIAVMMDDVFCSCRLTLDETSKRKLESIDVNLNEYLKFQEIQTQLSQKLEKKPKRNLAGAPSDVDSDEEEVVNQVGYKELKKKKIKLVSQLYNEPSQDLYNSTPSQDVVAPWPDSHPDDSQPSSQLSVPSLER